MELFFRRLRWKFCTARCYMRIVRRNNFRERITCPDINESLPTACDASRSATPTVKVSQDIARTLRNMRAYTFLTPLSLLIRFSSSYCCSCIALENGAILPYVYRATNRIYKHRRASAVSLYICAEKWHGIFRSERGTRAQADIVETADTR